MVCFREMPEAIRDNNPVDEEHGKKKWEKLRLMEKIEQPEAPEWLQEKWEEWGQEWEEKVKGEKNPEFRWLQHKNKKRKDLEQELAVMTRHHCSFCDAHPMGRRLKSTIEHFRPKRKFPLEAYKWENLFLACGLCQEKGDSFHERLLKPDEETYSFDLFFDIDWVTGELIPNPYASDEEQEQAEITIRLFRLNDNGKPDDRLEELDKFRKSKDVDIDIYSYRFFIVRGLLTV